MLALVLAMLLCVAVGGGVVGYVMVEARREGRGDFWTPEGEELIAGARRTSGKVVTKGERLVGSAAEVTQALRGRSTAVVTYDGPEEDFYAEAPVQEPAPRPRTQESRPAEPAARAEDDQQDMRRAS